MSKRIVGLLSIVFLSAPLGCGLFQGDLQDYYPIVLDHPVTLDLPEGQGTMVYLFRKAEKEGDKTLLSYTEAHILQGPDGKPISGQTQFDLLLSEGELTCTKMETVEINDRIFEEPQVFIRFPGITGRASWTNRLREQTYECTATFGPGQAGGKLYPNCLVVDEVGKGPQDFHRTRVTYAKGVGLIRMSDVRVDGTLDPKGMDFQRKAP